MLFCSQHKETHQRRHRKQRLSEETGASAHEGDDGEYVREGLHQGAAGHPGGGAWKLPLRPGRSV